jgi:ATP-dependent Clp protease ATP-binding subunit ClpA
LDKAAKEAIRLRQNWLGPEHYLLAVLAESSDAADVMTELGVTHERVADHLARTKRVNGRQIRYLESKGITTNPAAHDVSGWANGFAAAVGRQKPSPEDWLLAVLYEGSGIVESLLHELGTSAAAGVDAMRRKGVKTPEFNPPEYRPWRGRREVEVTSAEWQTVVDVLNEQVPSSSRLRWGFNSRRDRRGKIQFVAEDGIDLDAIVLKARSRMAGDEEKKPEDG